MRAGQVERGARQGGAAPAGMKWWLKTPPNAGKVKN